MAEFPAMPLWTDAYLGDTTHLDTMEHGAYLLLLITAWRTRDCALPDDNRLLARFARCSAAQWKKLRPIIEPFFEVSDGKWTQGRLTDEFALVRKRREIAASNGRASALKRKGRHSAKREQSDSDEDNGAIAERELGAQRQRQRKSNLTTATTTVPNDKSLGSRKTALPEGWDPEPFSDDAECRAIVDGWGHLERERQISRFKAHHEQHDSRFKNWQAAWKTWVLNSVDFDQRRGGGRPSRDEPKSLEDSILSDPLYAKAGKP